jgi:hypothetical protein
MSLLNCTPLHDMPASPPPPAPEDPVADGPPEDPVAGAPPLPPAAPAPALLPDEDVAPAPAPVEPLLALLEPAAPMA